MNVDINEVCEWLSTHLCNYYANHQKGPYVASYCHENVDQLISEFIRDMSVLHPKTYEECCEVLRFENTELVFGCDYIDINSPKEQWKRLGLINQFNKLLVCRDAYWKIYGEEFNWDNALYYIYTNEYGNVIESDDLDGRNCVLAFHNKASRDAFYKNFKKEIEMCKELL